MLYNYIYSLYKLYYLYSLYKLYYIIKKVWDISSSSYEELSFTTLTGNP